VAEGPHCQSQKSRAMSTSPNQSGDIETVMTRHSQVVVFVVGMALLCGCAHRQSQLSGVPNDVLEAWHSERSYYALVEIVDTYIDPFIHRATKQQVEALLGIQREDGHPGAGPDCWIYSSSRQIPRGSYLCIYFDGDGEVREIEWISE
jgi:hypothetical protein